LGFLSAEWVGVDKIGEIHRAYFEPDRSTTSAEPAADGQDGANEAVGQPHADRARPLPGDPGARSTRMKRPSRSMVGLCRRAIYDKMKMPIEAIFMGNARR
jgi:hypothetical protein